VSKTWTRGALFEPKMDGAQRVKMIEGWKDALRRALTPAS